MTHEHNEPNTPAIDSPALLKWVRQAGQIALHYFRHAKPQCKSDQTLITQADLEIEQFLSDKIRAAYPGHDLIGEEGARGVNGRTPTPFLWTLDPLDGTTAFVHGLPDWGIALGLLHQGQPRLGLFYMPALDEMTIAAHAGYGEVDPKVDFRGTVQPEWGLKGFLATSSASAHRKYRIDVGRIRTVGSVSANLVYTARGTAAAAFIPKARLWDLVAGAAILHRAGGALCYLSGERINYGQLLDGRLAPEPVIAGHPHMLAHLRQVIQPLSICPDFPEFERAGNPG